MMLIMRLCSSFTSFNKTAVCASQGKTVRVVRLGVTSQPCFFFSLQLLETRFFPSTF